MHLCIYAAHTYVYVCVKIPNKDNNTCGTIPLPTSTNVHRCTVWQCRIVADNSKDPESPFELLPSLSVCIVRVFSIWPRVGLLQDLYQVSEQQTSVLCVRPPYNYFSASLELTTASPPTHHFRSSS